jgi:cysteine desulfurase
MTEPLTLQRPVYMDYGATTPVDPRVAQAMIPYLFEKFGNPASRSHAYGWEAEAAVEEARGHVAALLNADAREIVWTSGATEGNNLAIKGAAQFYASRGKHIITQKTEHKAVLDTVRELERLGFTATYLDVDPDGRVPVQRVIDAIRPDTILVSIMMVNHEIGVVQDVAGIGAACRERGVLYHCDAVQAAGKIAIDLQELPIDLLTVTAHKVYGPKGIGALYVRRKPRVRIAASIHGGGHERGMRSGTLPSHQIVGMGEAFRLAKLEMQEESARVGALRDRLLAGLREIPEIQVNGSLEHRIPHNLNVSFSFVEGESLMMGIKDVAVSSGSACTSASLEPSHVLRSIGLSDELARASIRFGIGRFNTEEEIDYTLDRLAELVPKLRGKSPAWQVAQGAPKIATT